MRKLLLILTAVIMLSCVEPTSNNDFEKSVIRAELPTQADVPNSQPQAESNNDLTPTEPQTENNNPQEQPEQEIIIEPQQETESNYLLPIKNPNLNSYIYLTSSFNQGIWENETERFEFYEGWFFKYYKNKNDSVPTYQGSVKTYSSYNQTETKYFFHGTQNSELVIFCETTIDINGTGSIIIGEKTFSKVNQIIIEEPPEEPFNYLMPDKNFNLKDYFDNGINTDMNGTWKNKKGETILIQNDDFRYWDGINDFYGNKLGINQLTEPTIKGSGKCFTRKDYQKTFYYVCNSINQGTTIIETPIIFTEYKFVNVDSNINGWYKDLYLGEVQFVKVVNITPNPPVFID